VSLAGLGLDVRRVAHGQLSAREELAFTASEIKHT
jgi:hypothetical protein